MKNETTFKVTSTPVVERPARTFNGGIEPGVSLPSRRLISNEYAQPDSEKDLLEKIKPMDGKELRHFMRTNPGIEAAINRALANRGKP